MNKNEILTRDEFINLDKFQVSELIKDSAKNNLSVYMSLGDVVKLIETVYVNASSDTIENCIDMWGVDMENKLRPPYPLMRTKMNNE